MGWRQTRRGLFAAVWVAALGWLAWQDLAPSGQRAVASDLAQRQPYLSLPYPEGRLAAPEAVPGGWRQRVLDEPLYVDVRLPRRLDQVRLRVWYQAEGLPDLVAGLQVSVAPWRYDLKPLRDVSGGRAGSWTVGEATFPLDRAAVSAGQVRLLVAAPGVATSGALSLHRVEVVLTGQPLQPSGVLAAAVRQLRRTASYVR